jgi:hypothetical protein
MGAKSQLAPIKIKHSAAIQTIFKAPIGLTNRVSSYRVQLKLYVSMKGMIDMFKCLSVVRNVFETVDRRTHVRFIIQLEKRMHRQST